MRTQWVKDSNLVPDPALKNFVPDPNLVLVMPFGKYRGQPVSAIPLDYAQWALTNVKFKTSKLRQAFEERVKDAV